MKKTSFGILFVFVGLLGITACRAIVAGDPDRPIRIEAHITLDIRQIKETATSIEDMVSGKTALPKEKRSSLIEEWLVPTAWAEGPQLKYRTPEVEKALQARTQRYDSLQQFKSKGLIGENREGYVTAFGSNAAAASLVSVENQDRKTIYQTIVSQNGLAASAISTIQETFAQVKREKAVSGEKIQSLSGEWGIK